MTITAAAGRPLVPFLRKHLRAAHAKLNPPLAELSLALVGDAVMADLHERFMGVPGPTDVLTFPLDQDAAGRVTAGEVVVCVPEARRRSQTEKTRPDREALLYALHGMLHLCGFDDRTDADFAAMHAAEDAILIGLGVGPVFRPTEPPTAGRPSSKGKTDKNLRPDGGTGTAVRRASGVQSPHAMNALPPSTAAPKAHRSSRRRPPTRTSRAQPGVN